MVAEQIEAHQTTSQGYVVACMIEAQRQTGGAAAAASRRRCTDVHLHASEQGVPP